MRKSIKEENYCEEVEPVQTPWHKLEIQQLVSAIGRAFLWLYFSSVLPGKYARVVFMLAKENTQSPALGP